jgi:site-specific recombinase XerD
MCHPIGIIEVRHRAALAAVEAIGRRADLVLRTGTDRVADFADVKHCRSLLRIFRRSMDGKLLFLQFSYSCSDVFLATTSPYVFISERRAPLSVAGYQRMVARAGVAAKFTFLVHSNMLRHACGFKLGNDGHDTRAIQAYLGHRSIMSTVRYTALTPNRFKNFWKD